MTQAQAVIRHTKSLSHISQKTIDAIHKAGFRVYMRTPDDSWLYFVDDADRIGYAQETRSGFVSISTVHVPNKNTGTGFILDDIPSLSADNLAKAFVIAPIWATDRDRASVKKWASWEAFKASSPFNADYKMFEVV